MRGAGDDWGAALLRLAVAIAGQIADPDAEADEFADAATRFRRLEAPVPALWADALQACVLARQGVPGAADFARRVFAQAGRCQLGGVQALASMALEMAAAGGLGAGTGTMAGDGVLDRGLHRAVQLLTGSTSPKPPIEQEVSSPANLAAGLRGQCRG